MENLLFTDQSAKDRLRYIFAQSDSLIQKALKLTDFPGIAAFFAGRLPVEAADIDIYIMNGAVHLRPNGEVAFGAMYDGNEDASPLYVKNAEQVIPFITRADAPIILVSDFVVQDDMLFETTIVHEFAHLIDRDTAGTEDYATNPREEEARAFERAYLIKVHSLSSEEAAQYVADKYGKIQ